MPNGVVVMRGSAWNDKMRMCAVLSTLLVYSLEARAAMVQLRHSSRNMECDCFVSSMNWEDRVH